MSIEKITEKLNITQTNESSSILVQNDVELYLKILASIFYPISMILGIGGNTLVLIIFMFYQRVKSVTNFFIINLAISDLIFGLLCIPSTFITPYLIQHWPFSPFMCVFLNFMQNVSVTLTVYTLIWITLDKFWALVKPLKLRISIRVCKYLILVSWLFGLVTSLPIAMFTKIFYASNDDSQGKTNPQCSEQWPEGLEDASTVYNILLMLIQYFIPLIILSFCYAKIGFVLKRSKAPGESDSNRDAKMTKSKQKMLKMCFMMVLTFMILWAPLHIFNVYRFYDQSIQYSKYIGDIFFVCHILAVSRSFINPFIYAWINPKFRHGLKYYLLCYCFNKNESTKLKYANQKFLLVNNTNPNGSFKLNRCNSVNSNTSRCYFYNQQQHGYSRRNDSFRFKRSINKMENYPNYKSRFYFDSAGMTRASSNQSNYM
ncbi:unnamed protein product [Brachionus calyciflorus]|uniref:G-protein coupled receptors family 1 profile domain-containing protein n=1 Tax=Brachionus calyciflorus TaxID=104777 RepID=A0A813M9D8_9BILA|nr:unnamed protein product [Brachionus calyciflorus]